MIVDVLGLLADAIPVELRARGDRCADEGSIQILDAGRDRFRAATFGAEACEVKMRVDEDGDLAVSCTCPLIGRDGPCEHAWAMARVMERQGYELWSPSGKQPEVFDADALIDRLRMDEPLGSGPRVDVDVSASERLFLGSAKRDLGHDPWRDSWQARLVAIETATPRTSRNLWCEFGAIDARILYALDVRASTEGGWPDFRAWRQKRLQRGAWGTACSVDVPSYRAFEVAAGEDHELLALLASTIRAASPAWGWMQRRLATHELSAPTLIQVARRLCATGRFYLDHGEGPREPAITRDEGSPWVLGLRLGEGPSPALLRVTGFLERGEERMDVEEPDLLFGAGLVFAAGRMADFDACGAMPWVDALRSGGPLDVPVSERTRLVESLRALPRAPILEIEGEEAPRRIRPRPHLEVSPPEAGTRRRTLPCEIRFDYEGTLVSASAVPGHIVPEGSETPIRRDVDFEEQALASFLQGGGTRPPASRPDTTGSVTAKRLPGLVAALLAEGWTVEAEGVRYRQGGAFRLSVTSGIDWFDLAGVMDFGGQVAGLPALLDAARRGSRMVELGDGSKGMLPEDWLQGWEVASALGEVDGEGLRFRGNQGWILDALLAGRDEVAVDREFEKVRGRLATFRGIRPARKPRAFVGTLRGYQREGLAWLRFLGETGLGGCLADDMGLGKTIQVLAFLEARRAAGRKRSPSLVVAPRSVIFNWLEEAARFTPMLNVLDYTGPSRKEKRKRFRSHDVILTTYGTLRRDITELKDVRFGVVVLDEAQAIKNAHSQSAKAARLLRADQRLALSGTPIENHLGELWSLFEFLNPGMLGRAKAFQEFVGGVNGRTLEKEDQRRLASVIAPFVLRRTKEQVLPDLPARTDQVLHCEMKAAQRRDYNQCRDHYRALLLAERGSEPLGKNKLDILTALLRLRQAACHPALMDAKRRGDPSAKLDALLPMLEEVAAGGHKALVFSQFTKFLGIVRERLDERDIVYEYLDGRTRDRKAKVDRFQEDPDCRVFLISLKAGGLGLNLTAADYVFLLDPWWNPAVERQAVDRAHRIGQTRPVMAYRLICRDTVEEKVLTLQAEKQDLADAILAADARLIKTLTREDLELLLS